MPFKWTLDVSHAKFKELEIINNTPKYQFIGEWRLGMLHLGVNLGDNRFTAQMAD